MKQLKIIESNELMQEWDWEANKAEGLDPNKLTQGSGKKAHWICSKNHKFYSVIASRKHNGCPTCAKGHRVSVKEQIIYFYIKKYFKDAKPSFSAKWLGRKELDIYVPSIKVAVEYDGERYHTDINDDFAKDVLCKEQDIVLYHIRELKCPKSNKLNNKILLKGYSEKDLENGIKDLLIKLGIKNPIVCIDNDSNKIFNTIDKLHVENSLLTKNPELAKEWNYELNGNLKPEDVGVGSQMKVWWTSHKCNHTWRASIRNRNKGRGCPYCRGLAVLEGFNDAKTKIPGIERYWDYDRNNKNPEEVYYSTKEKFYFVCPTCGTETYCSLEQMNNKIKRGQKTLCTKCNNLSSINPNKKKN